MASRLPSSTRPGSRLEESGRSVISEPINFPQISEGLTQALQELAQLAWDGVPGCDGASVSLLQADAVSTLAATQQRITDIDEAQYRRDDGPCVSAIREVHSVTVDDYHGDTRWPEVAAAAGQAGIRSSYSLPLVDSGGRAVGGLNMYGALPAAFGKASRRPAEIFARHATLLITQLQLLHNERAARAREYQMAATLQRSLLPTLPILPGITSAARYLVSQEQAQVGGDWYDLFALPDGAIGIAIGDVMGHDVAAAAAMGQLRSVLRSYAYEGSSPSVVLERMDRLVQGFEMAQVATAIFGRLLRDESGATLLFANAGHLPPIVRRPAGNAVQLRGGSSPLIGVLEAGDRMRSETAVSMPPGSLIVLYTDGLVETREREQHTGSDQLCAALNELSAEAEPEEVCESLLHSMLDGGQEDDVALLVVRIDDLGK
jgi:serine phosphatase RsbU (regulator of sigma subunit)